MRGGLDEKATALRRQRARRNATTPPTTEAPPAAVVAASTTTATTAASTTPRTTNALLGVTPQRSRLMQESTQVAEEAAEILASVRQQTRATTAARTEEPVGATLPTPVPATTTTTSMTTTSRRHEDGSLHERARRAVALGTSRPTTTMPEDPPHHRERPPTRGGGGAITSTITTDMAEDPPPRRHHSPVPNEEPESETMADQLEPLVPDALIDAQCFHTQQTILLRTTLDSHTVVPSRASTVLATECGVEEDGSVVRAQGWGLTRPEETWILYVVGETTNTSPTLRYGDTVCLCSSLHRRFLGVKPVERGKTILFQPGCYRTQPGRSEWWNVLRSPTLEGKPIGIGPAALHRSTAQKGVPSRRLTAPVKSGEGVVLRSCQTGGVVSIQPDGSIRLLMDSYDSDTVRHGRPEETTLLQRLQRHDKLVPSKQETIYFLHAGSPPLPEWCLGGMGEKRSYMEGAYCYLQDKHRHAGERQGCDSEDLQFTEKLMSFQYERLAEPDSQEQVLVKELLGAFLGLEGHYIRVDSIQREQAEDLVFRLVDPEPMRFNKVLHNLITELLPLATYYVGVQRFVATHFDHCYGSVMHALCEKLDQMLGEYMNVMESLDPSQSNSKELLRNLQVSIGPQWHRMACLYQVVRSARRTTGGALLNTLHRLKLETLLGNTIAEQVIDELLDFASIPYFRMFCGWVEYGELRDPYNEFMVRQREAATWDATYTVTSAHVLEHLLTSKALIAKVLNTGRYWNVINAKGHEPSTGTAPQLSYKCGAAEMSSYIEINYQRASELLVTRLLESHGLLSSLKLMKRYFLLDQGDFFVYFMEAAETELSLDVGRLSRGQIEYWFNVSVQITEHGEVDADEIAPKAECANQLTPSKLRCGFAAYRLVDTLDKGSSQSLPTGSENASTSKLDASVDTKAASIDGINALVIGIADIPYPVSLVLNPSALEQYQLLFRHLFIAKHVERRLLRAWQDHQGMRELQTPLIRGLIGPTFHLRARMLHFVQNLINYLVVEVIDTHWEEMETAISPTAHMEQTIDDILRIHQSFLDKTLDACFLTSRHHLRNLTRIFNTCTIFADQMDRFMEATRINADSKRIATEKRRSFQKTRSDRERASKDSSIRKQLHVRVKEEREERRKRVHEQAMRVKLEVESPSYQSMIAQLSHTFSQNLSSFLTDLQRTDNCMTTPRALNLTLRLDFNQHGAGSANDSVRSKSNGY